MRIYAHTFSIGIQSALVYRWNFVLRCICAFIPLMGTIFFWDAVMAGRGEVAGYSYDEMVTYFVAILVMDSLAAPTDDDFQIAGDIREGFINQVLLKPVDYLAYRLSLFAAGRAVYAASAALPLAVMMAVLWDHLVPPDDGRLWALAALALLGSAALQFLITFCTALCAFWMLDIGGIVFILFGLEYLLGGHVFPLDLLPEWLYRGALCLPFAYEFYFPAALIGGRLDAGEMAWGFALQWAWIGTLGWLAGALWRAGLREYTAVGG